MSNRSSVRRGAARLSKRTNGVLGPILTRLPGFGVLHHIGRASGRSYRTPLRLIGDPSTGDGYFVLTYGPDTDWYQNLHANQATFDTRAGSFAVSSPQLVKAADVGISRPLATTLRILDIPNVVYVTLTPTHDGEIGTPAVSAD